MHSNNYKSEDQAIEVVNQDDLLVARNLISFRNQRKFSINDLEMLSGIDKFLLIDYENAFKPIPVADLMCIAHALRVEVVNFFTNELNSYNLNESDISKN